MESTGADDKPEERATNLHGVSGPDRYIAAVVDAWMTFLLAAAIVAWLGTERTRTLTGIAAVSVFLVYYLVAEWLFATTVGKAFMGLRVVTTDGNSCGIRQATIRTFARVIEVNPLLLGALPAALLITVTRRRQRLGDLIAGTMVVRKSCLYQNP